MSMTAETLICRPETKAATFSIQAITGWVKQTIMRMIADHQAREELRMLIHADERILRDIGLTRGNAMSALSDETPRLQAHLTGTLSTLDRS